LVFNGYTEQQCFCSPVFARWKGVGIFKWSPCANVFKLKSAAVIW